MTTRDHQFYCAYSCVCLASSSQLLNWGTDTNIISIGIAAGFSFNTTVNIKSIKIPTFCRNKPCSLLQCSRKWTWLDLSLMTYIPSKSLQLGVDKQGRQWDFSKEPLLIVILMPCIPPTAKELWHADPEQDHSQKKNNLQHSSAW